MPETLPTNLATRFDNPAGAEAGSGQEEVGRPSPAQLQIRETTQVAWAGFMMLVPPLAPRYLLVPDAVRKQLQVFDLLRPSGPGVAVLGPADDWSVQSCAVSADGDSICLACNAPGVTGVFDTAHLLEAATALLARAGAKDDNQVSPRTYTATVGRAPSDVTFSEDAARLFVLHRRVGVKVHDARQPMLPTLRTLSFEGVADVYSNYHLACVGGLLAAAGGGGEFSIPLGQSSAEEVEFRQQVRVWRVDEDGETHLHTVRNPDLTDSVAIQPQNRRQSGEAKRSDGSLVAIGLRNGVVRLLKTEDLGREEDACVNLLPHEAEGALTVHTLSFSYDGSRLVAGRSGTLNDFTVYDVASATVVARFVRPKSMGAAATFFPKGDVLVTGSMTSARQCTFHRLLPPVPRFKLALGTSVEITNSDVALAGEHGLVAAMAAGSQVELVGEDGNVVLKKNLEKQVSTSLANAKTAVRIQPGGKFLACVVDRTTLVVLAVADGCESLRVSDIDSCNEICWNPVGTLLALGTGRGAQFISASDTGFSEVPRLLESDRVYSLAFDSTGEHVAIGTMGGRLTVWDTATWKCTRSFAVGNQVMTVCFSWKGDRLAYLTSGYDAVVMSLEAGSESQVVFAQVNAGADLQFSPDDKFLLCCPDSARRFDQHRMRVLDLATGTDAEWGEQLRTMALPIVGGTLCGRTLGWAQLALPQSPTRADTTDRTDGHARQWVLYGAVGEHLIAMDINLSLLAIHDNAWTSEQLVIVCSAHQQEQVRSLAECAPHCSNIRDVATGETMLHCMVRTRQVESLIKWLGLCPHVEPLVDAQGQTALQVALQLDEIESAQALWKALSPSLTSVSASLVMQELQSMSRTHPDLVRPFLLDVEPCLVQTLATFRTELARAAEVCGLPTPTLPDAISVDATTFEQESAMGMVPAAWVHKCPQLESASTLVASRVVLLPELLGDANSSPFHNIVAHCDASVFESKLLELVVQNKWEENVRSLRLWSFALYSVRFVIGTLAMAFAANIDDADISASSTADMLQALVFGIELSSRGAEAIHLVSGADKAHHVCLLYSPVSIAAHFTTLELQCAVCAGSRRLCLICHDVELIGYCVEWLAGCWFGVSLVQNQGWCEDSWCSWCCAEVLRAGGLFAVISSDGLSRTNDIGSYSCPVTTPSKLDYS